MAEYEHLRASRAVEAGDAMRPALPRPTPLSARIARERARSGRVVHGGTSYHPGPPPDAPPPALDAVRAAHAAAASARGEAPEPEPGRLARLGGRLRGRRSG